MIYDLHLLLLSLCFACDNTPRFGQNLPRTSFEDIEHQCNSDVDLNNYLQAWRLKVRGIHRLSSPAEAEANYLRPTDGDALRDTNPRGIPYAPFVDRVEDYVTSRAEVEGTLKNFQEMIS